MFPAEPGSPLSVESVGEALPDLSPECLLSLRRLESLEEILSES